jgi:hypothetical protein
MEKKSELLELSNSWKEEDTMNGMQRGPGIELKKVMLDFGFSWR